MQALSEALFTGSFLVFWLLFASMMLIVFVRAFRQFESGRSGDRWNLGVSGNNFDIVLREGGRYMSGKVGHVHGLLLGTFAITTFALGIWFAGVA